VKSRIKANQTGSRTKKEIMENRASNFFRRFFDKHWGAIPFQRTALILLVSFLIATALLSACATLPDPAPATPDLSIPLTNAAQTAETQGTLAAGETAVVQLTSLAAGPTLPPIAPTAPPPPTPTQTAPPLPPTSPPKPCYRAEILADIGAPPNSLLPVGAPFVKTWRIRNAGDCPWTQQFSLVLSGGDPMGTSTNHPLGGPIAPGEILNLSIALTAPGFPGAHQGNWFLRSASGEMFGDGPNASIPLQVIIRTVQPINFNIHTYDLISSMCSASWESGSGILGCPGLAGDPNGSITLLEKPRLESRIDSGLALLTRPNLAVDGWIRGRFPTYFVQNNDHFMTEIGCLNGSPNCQINFRLDYRAPDGSIGQLGNWRETHNGQTTLIDLDLSSLTGKAIQLIFFVGNVGNANNANAFWLMPRIQNRAPTSDKVLTWTREGFPGLPCAELRIYQNNVGQAEAQAISCSPYRYELGRISLTAQEQQKLQEWIQRLKSFDAEISHSSPGTPIVTWLSFQGLGINVAQDPDLQAINTFAASLFNKLAP
jgi:hypothetical protein